MRTRPDLCIFMHFYYVSSSPVNNRIMEMCADQGLSLFNSRERESERETERRTHAHTHTQREREREREREFIRKRCHCSPTGNPSLSPTAARTGGNARRIAGAGASFSFFTADTCQACNAPCVLALLGTLKGRVKSARPLTVDLHALEPWILRHISRIQCHSVGDLD